MKKVQKSLDFLWQFTGEFFEMDEIDNNMLQEGIGVDNKKLKNEWDKIIIDTLNKEN